MYLRLIAQAAYANEVSAPFEFVFDGQGGNFGRDPRCQLVLTDPLRRISRVQGQIVWENGAFHLINASTSNPIYVNGRELSPGARTVIDDSGEWRTGNYLITAQRMADMQGNPTPQPAGAATDTGPGHAPTHAIHPASMPVNEHFAAVPAQQAVSSGPSFAEPVPAAAVQPIAEPQSLSPAAQMRGPFDDLLGAPVSEQDALLGGAQNIAPASSSTELPDPFAVAYEAPPVPTSAAPFDPLKDRSVSDPFADLMGAPIDRQVSSAPASRIAQEQARAAMIPDDFNPMSMGGVAHRNREDPLNDLLAPAHVKDMFPERSVDAIFHPADGSIETMTRDPLQDSQHQAFMDPSSKLDPLQIFSQRRTEDVLNPEFLFANGNVQEKSLSDHSSELASYFRAPKPVEAEQAQAQSDAYSQRTSSLLPGTEHLFAPQTPAEAIPAQPAAEIAAPDVTPVQPARIQHVAENLAPSQTPPGGSSTQAVNLESIFDLSGPADHLADLGVALPAGPPPHMATPFNEPLGQPEDIAPRVVPASTGTAPEAETPAMPQAEAAPVSAPDTQALLEAFKRGAGLSEARYPERLTPEMMFMAGQMLSASVQGCMDLLSSRAAAKQEVRIAVTLINAEANNPLKFLPTGASALAQIFGPRMPGFMSGPAAIDNAHYDLRMHEVGMMAGTQAAVQGLFERFDPTVIEGQLEEQGRHRPLFAAQRSARLWEMYCSHYRWLKDELKNQTPTSWGQVFHNAYHSEIDSNSTDEKGFRQ